MSRGYLSEMRDKKFRDKISVIIRKSKSAVSSIILSGLYSRINEYFIREIIIVPLYGMVYITYIGIRMY